MVATSDFSGLVSSACALASAAAMVPMDSLERCMAALHAQDIKAHRTGFGSFGSNAMADRFLGVVRHKGLELRLGLLMHRFDPRAGRLDSKHSRNGSDCITGAVHGCRPP